MTAAFGISISGKAGCRPGARVECPGQALHASGLAGTPVHR
jgi:hypothetical protein